MFWQMLAHIPKGILEKTRKYCFNFLWQGISDYKGTLWVNWYKLVVSKSLGGRDLIKFTYLVLHWLLSLCGMS